MGSKMVSNNTLVTIASIGGLVTASVGYVCNVRTQSYIKNSDTYQDAMNALRTHKKAVPYFGEPIRMSRIKYGDGHRNVEPPIPYKWFKIPIKGSNTKGSMYYEVTLNNKIENKSEVSKIEVSFDNIPGKTFIIRDC